MAVSESVSCPLIEMSMTVKVAVMAGSCIQRSYPYQL